MIDNTVQAILVCGGRTWTFLKNVLYQLGNIHEARQGKGKGATENVPMMLHLRQHKSTFPPNRIYIGIIGISR